MSTGVDRRLDDPFRILFVCTGNICRSPFAEILTRHILIGKLGGNRAAAFPVSSAGVQAVVGAGMHPQTRAELTPWGLHTWPAGRFVAHQLAVPDVKNADLVLTAEREHRSAVVELDPGALGRTFTMREFARLLTVLDRRRLPADTCQRARHLVEAARQYRGTVPNGPHDDRLPDPVGRSQAVHHQAAMLICQSVSTFAEALVPPRTGLAPRR